MKNVRLGERVRTILWRTSGKSRDGRSAEAMKNFRIHRPPGHGRNMPPELGHRHFRHPEGGDMCWLHDEQRILCRKSGLLWPPGALLEEGSFKVRQNEAPSLATAHSARGQKKHMTSFLKNVLLRPRGGSEGRKSRSYSHQARFRSPKKNREQQKLVLSGHRFSAAGSKIIFS